jgi:hypothetical protein
MLVIVDVHTAFQTKSVRMFTVYLHTKCRISSSNGTVFIAVKLKAK